MKSKKSIIFKWVVFLLILSAVVTFFYIRHQERRMIQMRRGDITPIFWELADSRIGSSSPYISDDILVIELDNKKLDDQLDITLTDIYYLPNLKQIHFGLWYDSKDYDDEFQNGVFYTELEDDQGNVYDHYGYANGRNGIFGQFQQRSINNINLTDKEEVYLNIYPIKRADDEILYDQGESILIYTGDTEFEYFDN